MHTRSSDITADALGTPEPYRPPSEYETGVRQSESEADTDREQGPVQVAVESSGEPGIDYGETLAAVAELALRSLADVCIIDVIENGELRRVHVAHANPAMADIARRLLRYPLDPRRPHLALKALATRRPVFIPEVTERMLDSFSQSEEHRRLIRALHPRSLMAIPLIARGRVLGTALYVSERRAFGKADLVHAGMLARLAAIELDRARLYVEAQRALEARDRVLGVVAHDLRNPLNVISICGGLLLDPSLPEIYRERQVRLILRSAERMDRLIGDLLDVTRIEADQLLLQFQTVDPALLVREAVELNASLASDRRIALRAEAGEDLPVIRADRDRLLQVLANLIGNAIKFTPRRGVIVVRVDCDGEACRFSVTDTGPGIPPEELPRLFEAFWQAQRGTVEGTGLGLTIARGIVEGHHGRIWAESTLGSGSTFLFTIPHGDHDASPSTGDHHAGQP